MTDEAAVARQRMDWMDNLRGVSILLVILYHATIVAFATDEGTPAALRYVSDLFAPLRMPTMVLLSGMLVTGSLQKGARAYVAGKIRNILHPYLVWSAITIVVLVEVLGVMTYRPEMLRWVLVAPVDHLWFLWFLMFYYAIALLTRHIPPVVVAGAFYLTALVLSMITGSDKELAYLGAFFMIGVAIGRAPERLDPALSRTWLKALFVPVAGALLVLPLIVGDAMRYRAELGLVAMLGVLGVVIVARRLDGRFQVVGLRFVGRESIVFYLLHLPLIRALDTLTREVLAPPVALVVAVFVALAASTALALASRRYRAVALLFRFPPRRIRLQTGAALPGEGGVRTGSAPAVDR